VEVERQTGPEFLAAMLQMQVRDWRCQDIHDRGVPVGGIWPNGIVSFCKEYFYPYAYWEHHWPQFSLERYPMCYTAHHWLGSWQDQDPVTVSAAPVSLPITSASV
jgi:hypothetical protein